MVPGFQPGEMVIAVVKAGKKVGRYTGRVSVRSNGYFDMQTATRKATGIVTVQLGGKELGYGDYF
jgi:hypothetical protein